MAAGAKLFDAKDRAGIAVAQTGNGYPTLKWRCEVRQQIALPHPGARCRQNPGIRAGTFLSDRAPGAKRSDDFHYIDQSAEHAAAVTSVAVMATVSLAAAPRSAAAQVTYTCPYGYFYSNGYCSPYSWYAPFDSGTEFDYGGLDPGWGGDGRRGGFHGEGFFGGGSRGEDLHAGGGFHGGGFHGGGGHGGGGHR